MSRTDIPAHGFVLVTVDPELAEGGRAAAFDLVRWRLERGRWPIFKNTRCRRQMVPGSRLAFYVAGFGQHAGMIVATATLKAVHVSRRVNAVDPPHFLTDLPDSVLELSEVAFLDPPVSFRDVAPRLSISPKNPRKWGVIVQGGVRALSEKDWRLVFRQEVGRRARLQ